MGAALTEFSGTYAKHPSLRTGLESAVYGKVWWRIITLNVVTLPACLCLGAFDALYFLHEELSPSIYPLYGVIGFVQAYIFGLPSTSLGNLNSFPKGERVLTVVQLQNDAYIYNTAVFELLLFCIGILNQSLQKYHTSLLDALQQG